MINETTLVVLYECATHMPVIILKIFHYNFQCYVRDAFASSHFSQMSLTGNCPAFSAISDMFLTSFTNFDLIATRYAFFNLPHWTRALTWRKERHNRGINVATDHCYISQQSALFSKLTEETCCHPQICFSKFIPNTSWGTMYIVPQITKISTNTKVRSIIMPFFTLLLSLVNSWTSLSTCLDCKEGGKEGGIATN